MPDRRGRIFTIAGVAIGLAGLYGAIDFVVVGKSDLVGLTPLLGFAMLAGSTLAAVFLAGIGHLRGERYAGRIGLAAVLVCQAVFWGSFSVSPNEAQREAARASAENERVRRSIEERERNRTWGGSGGITDFAVGPGGKIVIAGPAIARLLPDGSADPGFVARITAGPSGVLLALAN